MNKNKKERPIVLHFIPGIFIACMVMFLGLYGAKGIGQLLIAFNMMPAGSASPISGVFVAIILGIVIRNIVGLHTVFLAGVQFSVKYMLRIGIVLLGFRLSFLEAIKLGAWGLPIIVACITSGLLITIYFTNKLRVSRRLGTLIAGGTSICGVTAIMALSPGIKAKDDEVSYAVATITIFGLLSMLLYPYIANFFFAEDPIKAGMFLGTAIHDTAQVTGAALIYGQMFELEKVIDVATVTKLTRNLFIIVVLPVVTFLFYRNKNQGQQKDSVNEVDAQSSQRWYHFVPLFVIGFLVASLIRTMGDSMAMKYDQVFYFLSPVVWEQTYQSLSTFGATYLLGIAMAGVGLSTNLRMFKGMGLKPLYIGLVSALCVSFVSFILVSILGDYVQI